MPADPTYRPPAFFKEITADSTATLAIFERVPHPRASVELQQQPPPRRTPAPVKASAFPQPPPSHAPLPPPPSEVPPPPSPPARAQPPSAPPTAGALSTRQLEEAIASIRLQASRLAEQTRSDALEIGFQVARRILETELTTSAEPLFALVRTAVRRVGDARKLVIKLHPDDAVRVDTPEARSSLGLTVLQVEVQADSSLKPGDVMVETDTTTVDGRLSTRLDEVKRAVSNSLEEDPS